jgi:hypothetical protein
MRHKAILYGYVFVAIVVGYHLRWLYIELDKYVDYKKPRSVLCKQGDVYEQVEPYSSVYVRNENLTCVEK